jgi:hypothetical protein
MSLGALLEANDHARATDVRIKPGAMLATAGEDRSLPTVRLRLYQAGLRLAAVLNEAVPAGQADDRELRPRSTHRL